MLTGVSEGLASAIAKLSAVVASWTPKAEVRAVQQEIQAAQILLGKRIPGELGSHVQLPVSFAFSRDAVQLCRAVFSSQSHP